MERRCKSRWISFNGERRLLFTSLFCIPRHRAILSIGTNPFESIGSDSISYDMLATSSHPSQRFEVSLLGQLPSSIHPLLIEKLSRMSILSSPFVQEESLMQPLVRQLGARGEDGMIRARKVDENGEIMTYLVAYQRPESVRATPQALVTPCTYTQILTGCSGEEAATQIGFQKVSSSTKRGFVFMLSVGLRIEVYSIETSDVRSPSIPELYTIEVKSPPIPYALVAQTIEHALNIKRQLVGLVKLGRVEGSI